MDENIDAERASFEAWAELTGDQKPGANHEVIGWYYFDEVTQDRWEAWHASAARRTPSASIGENGLPALSDAVQSVIACARRVHAKFGTDSDWSEWRDLGDALAEFDAAPPLSSEQQAEKGKS